MFCVWSDTPSVDVPLKDVQDLIAAMATANSAYFTKKPTETQNTFSVTASSGSGSEADTATLTVNGTTTLTATTEATWTSSDESVVKRSAAQTANAAKAAAVSTAITGTAVTATAVGAGTATITATSTADPSKTAQITLTVAAGDSALRNVTLPINLWITNTGVVPTGWTNGKNDFQYSDTSGNRRSIYTLRASVAGVATENGIELSSILNQDKKGTAKSWDGNTYNVVFWKNAYHDASHRQSTDGWSNESLNGTEFQYIRYWNENWAYSTDGTDWVTISNVGAGANDTGKNQVNIWYRQVTTVTDEITTLNVDWGPAGEPTTNTRDQILDYAVKYESGQMTPTTFPNDGKSVVYDMGQNNTYSGTDTTGKYRIVYGITGLETADYELYMITLTPNPNTRATSWGSVKKYTYNSENEKAIWVKSEADLPSDITPFSNDAFYGDCVYGGEPTVDRAKIYEGKSLLVTYYVRAKQTEDSLTVHYIDATDANNQTEFYSYNIAVAGGTVFHNNIRLPETTIDGVTSLTNGKVINKNNRAQYVSSDLTTMPAIGAQYRYVPNNCTNVERRDDKNVYLYYTFNNKLNYVVDFGLPLEIKLTDLSANLSTAEITSVTFRSARYGTPVYDSNRKLITYTLNGMLSEQESFTVEVKGTKDGQTSTVAYIVTIIPASTVYYEDNFVAFSGNWQREGDTTTNAVQDLDALTAQKTYGYDSHYGASSKFSLGSAMKTTVSSATNSNPPTATFTFKGTGFDLVSMTSKDTGTILVNVNGTTENNETVTKHWIVDTFYGYTRQEQGVIEYTWTKGSDGTWHNKAVVKDALPAGATIGGTPMNSGDKTYEPNYIWTPAAEGDNALYQIPVIHYTDLPYGTYTVTVTPKYSSKRDPYYQADGNNNSYDFYLDGVRIYNPAGDKLNSQYVKDGEGYAKFTEIRNMLLNASGLTANIQPTSGMVFVDGAGTNGQLADYTNYGPNNEVYLSKNQAIAFKISDVSNIDSIQIGAKAPNGNATMQIKVGTNELQVQNLTTASDMYYKLENVQADQTIVITNASDSLLSLTTLKVTYKADPSASNSADPVVDEEVVAQAPVMLMSMLYGEPETFEPEHFTAKWSRNVRKGGTATLTVKASADVKSITVNGEKITAYTTKTARSFWGPKETYHVFTYRVTNAVAGDYTIYALNADGVASDPITAPLTVRPSIRDWWNGIFDKWKH